ncbi:MAG: hypothetical protein CAPSK01_001612 [Candidatus Accumulibacter vicinus]|uniref:Uncharacterized protein n=1 Tax=Candidatus Accumulibacter vicinus TaxID=2954382 RepID=A0A084Y214_9PROT|nr:MAG: hypothetical protein CAPSK01_001612 [Candidatus Accumulibacter vicinus]
MQQIDDIAQQPSDVGCSLQKLDPPGLDFRDFEHIVDQGQQMIARAIDDLEVLPVGLTERLGLGHQFGKPDDRVEWRAQFVAHVRNKGALRPTCRFGAVQGRDQGEFLLSQLLDRRRQMALTSMQNLVEAHPRQQQIVLYRLGQIIHCAEGESPSDELVGLEHRGQENDRDVARALRHLQVTRRVEAVHAGHLDVQQNQVHVTRNGLHQRLLARGSLDHLAAGQAGKQCP